MKNRLRLRGQIELELKKASGERRIFFSRNLVVDTGLVLLVNCLNGTQTALTHMAVGTGADEVQHDDTMLKGTQLARVAGTRTLEGNIFRLTAVFLPGVGTGVIEEVGIFNAQLGGTMFSRMITGQIEKEPTDQLTGRYALTIENHEDDDEE